MTDDLDLVINLSIKLDDRNIPLFFFKLKIITNTEIKICKLNENVVH